MKRLLLGSVFRKPLVFVSSVSSVALLKKVKEEEKEEQLKINLSKKMISQLLDNTNKLNANIPSHLYEKQIAAQKYLKHEQRISGFPGCSVTIIQNNSIVFSYGLGYSDLENNVLAKPDSVYRIASISKSITSAALGVLMNKNMLNLDDSIDKYLSDYPTLHIKNDNENDNKNNNNENNSNNNSNDNIKITVRNCGSHTSGIRHYKDKEFYQTKEFSCSNDTLNIFKNDPLKFKPNSKFSYSTYNYCVLESIIESISKMSLNKFIDKNIFKVFEMNNTYLENHSNIVLNRVKQYSRNKKNGRLINSPYVNNSNKYCGGGIQSTSFDLALFGYLLFCHRDKQLLFSEEVYNELLKQNILSDGSKIDYTIGWNVKRDEKTHSINFIGHSGGAVGGCSYLLILPQQNIVVCILINMDKASPKQIAVKLSNIFNNITHTV